MISSKILFQKIESSIINNAKTKTNSSSNLKLATPKHSKEKNYFNLKNLKHSCYNLLERPSGKTAFIYRCFTFLLILAPIILNALTTINPVSKMMTKILFIIEIFVTIFFFLEYCVRVWSSGYRSVYQGLNGKLKFMSRPIMIIELVMFFFGSFLLIGSICENYSFNSYIKDFYFTSAFLMVLRFSQLVRLLYVDRKAHTFVLLSHVIIKHKYELITSVYIGFIILLLSSYLIYICENKVNSSFHTYSDALYWATITMTTIGYGIFDFIFFKN